MTGRRKAKDLAARANSLNETTILSSLRVLSSDHPRDKQEHAARVLLGELERWAPKATSSILRGRYGGFDHVVADAIQETVLRTMTCRGPIRASTGREAAAWIARVFHNALVDELRRLARTPGLVSRAVATTSISQRPNPEPFLVSADVVQGLESLKKLALPNNASSLRIQRAARQCLDLLGESNARYRDEASSGRSSSAKRKPGPPSKQELKRAKNRVYQARRRARLLLAELLAAGETGDAGKSGK